MTSLLAKSPEVSPTKSLLISIKVLDSAQPQMAFVKLNVRRQRSKNVFFPTVALIKKQILKLSWKKSPIDVFTTVFANKTISQFVLQLCTIFGGNFWKGTSGFIKLWVSS